MKPYVDDCAKTVRARGYRFTPQRQLILDAICESGGHITPDEIYSRVRAKLPTVNRATVYRNVDFLCEMRFLVAAQIGRQMYYEMADHDPHHHLVCRNCNDIVEIKHDTVKGLFSKIQREVSFQVDMEHLVLFGLCGHCQKTETYTKRNQKRINMMDDMPGSDISR
jgi:Fur family transcriptional regulator, ferric uptake regulator